MLSLLWGSSFRESVIVTLPKPSVSDDIPSLSATFPPFLSSTFIAVFLLDVCLLSVVLGELSFPFFFVHSELSFSFFVVVIVDFVDGSSDGNSSPSSCNDGNDGDCGRGVDGGILSSAVSSNRLAWCLGLGLGLCACGGPRFTVHPSTKLGPRTNVS